VSRHPLNALIALAPWETETFLNSAWDVIDFNWFKFVDLNGSIWVETLAACMRIACEQETSVSTEDSSVERRRVRSSGHRGDTEGAGRTATILPQSRLQRVENYESTQFTHAVSTVHLLLVLIIRYWWEGYYFSGISGNLEMSGNSPSGKVIEKSWKGPKSERSGNLCIQGNLTVSC